MKFATQISPLLNLYIFRAAINQLMEDEYRTDIETVLKWTGDVDDYEEDIINMLTFQLKVKTSSTS